MKKNEIKQTDQEEVDTIKEINKILEMQKIPLETQLLLKSLMHESLFSGWQWVVLKAYCLGLITGKRIERRRRAKHI